MRVKSFIAVLLALVCAAFFVSCDIEFDLPDAPSQYSSPTSSQADIPSPGPADSSKETQTIDENGVYDQKDDVALYIHTYGHLPQNYITKADAQALGWPGGGLDGYADGKCIGGDRFGNYEGLLPEKSGRTYTECDIDTLHKNNRGAKRIIFSNDGLIYYTDDHYEHFTLLYGDE